MTRSTGKGKEQFPIWLLLFGLTEPRSIGLSIGRLLGEYLPG
ncbi:hypothetical protein [Achromobacter phage tuull]|nr:hypothetical protein [Achromobacter phage tuull]